MVVNFNGNLIKYEDDVFIEYVYDEDYNETTFDIYFKGKWSYGYCRLDQAHCRVLRLIDGGDL